VKSSCRIEDKKGSIALLLQLRTTLGPVTCSTPTGKVTNALCRHVGQLEGAWVIYSS
jgi:hypothetical protein